MTREELLALPVAFSIDVAGRAMGMGRDKSRRLNHAGEFPIPVRQLGPKLVCLRHELLDYLGVSEQPAAQPRGKPPAEPGEPGGPPAHGEGTEYLIVAVPVGASQLADLLAGPLGSVLGTPVAPRRP